MEHQMTRVPAHATRKPFSFERFPNGESRYVCATFTSLDRAQEAVDALEAQGCQPSEISVLLADERRRHRLRTHPEFEGLDPDSYVVDPVELDRCTMTLQGTGAGATIGGAVGALGGIAAAGSVALAPASAGLSAPLLGALAGAGAVGAVGGLVGGFVGARRSEYRARRLEHTLRHGSILLRTKARTEADRGRIARILTEMGGIVSFLGSTA